MRTACASYSADAALVPVAVLKVLRKWDYVVALLIAWWS